MKQTGKLLILLISLTFLAQGCKKEYFDKELVEEILNYSFHNDTVDARHTWNLISEGVIQVVADLPDTKKVLLLSENPYVSQKAEVLAEADAQTGDTVRLHYAVPLIQEKLYIDAMTSSDKHLVGEVTRSVRSVDMSSLAIVSSGNWSEPAMQEVYYCYCNTYPQPSPSWDFNDLVLRITRTLIDEKTLRLKVTLVAVGTTAKQAAAIQLSGVRYEDLDSVSLVYGKPFVTDNSLPREIIKESDNLIEGRKGEAVINLFDDAHAAFYSRPNASGMVNRYYYNVTTSTDASHFTMAPKSISYDIHFKKPDVAEDVTFARIDPFIIYGYNGAMWEVHKYTYKFYEVLYEFYSGNPKNYDTGYTWALEIPYSWFGYPKEGKAIGSYKNGALYGAYQTYNHSFGQWAADRNQCKDWYLYPQSTDVMYN